MAHFFKFLIVKKLTSADSALIFKLSSYDCITLYKHGKLAFLSAVHFLSNTCISACNRLFELIYHFNCSETVVNEISSLVDQGIS